MTFNALATPSDQLRLLFDVRTKVEEGRWTPAASQRRPDGTFDFCVGMLAYVARCDARSLPEAVAIDSSTPMEYRSERFRPIARLLGFEDDNVTDAARHMFHWNDTSTREQVLGRLDSAIDLLVLQDVLRRVKAGRWTACAGEGDKTCVGNHACDVVREAVGQDGADVYDAYDRVARGLGLSDLHTVGTWNDSRTEEQVIEGLERGIAAIRAGLDGPSRTIKVEPIEAPVTEPVEAPAEAPPAPVEPEKVPA